VADRTFFASGSGDRETRDADRGNVSAIVAAGESFIFGVNPKENLLEKIGKRLGKIGGCGKILGGW
jgi:hypothetical protein